MNDIGNTNPLCRLEDDTVAAGIQSLIDCLPFYVLLVDEDHCIVLANSTTAAVLKRSTQEIIGGYCPKVVHGLNHPFEGCPLEEAVAAGSMVARELENAETGSWIESAIYPTGLKTAAAKSVYYHTVRDITEAKHAHEAECAKDAAEAGLRDSLARLEESFAGLIGALARTVERRDPYTAGHQRRVAALAVAIARRLRLSEREIEGINMAATVHDIGKIYVPAEILNKPGKLTATEFDLIKAHSQAGYEILKDISFDQPIAAIVRQHHERLDGSGYPQGLRGDDIETGAKIIAVADVVEAITAHRPYRPGLGLDVALDEISTRRGSLYDPDIADSCLDLFNTGEFEFNGGAF